MGITRRVVAGLCTLVFVGSLVGCGDAGRGPSGPSALTAPLLSATQLVKINDRVEFAQLAFVPCANNGAGELVLISGTLHILIHQSVSDDGNFHSKIHFQPQGVSGVGLTTGDTYRATGVTQTHTNIGSGSAINETFINNFRIIGQGPDNNLLVHQTVHITINANGEVTSVVDNTSVECR